MLLKADARAVPLRDETVQCVVTSPPYWGLRDYGIKGQLGLEATLEEYVTELVTVFREVRRVLRKDGVRQGGSNGQRRKETERFDRPAYVQRQLVAGV